MAMRFTMAEGWIVVNATGMGEQGRATWLTAGCGGGLGSARWFMVAGRGHAG